MTDQIVAPVLSEPMIETALKNHRPIHCKVPGLRPAAVLIALFAHPKDGTTHLWLIERTDDGGAHASQVALPGGKPTSLDSDLQATALREAWEELGIPPAKVRVVGTLDDYPTITGFRIRPFVGWIPSTVAPQPNPAEVAKYFAAPLSVFLGPGARNWVQWTGLRRFVRCYEVEGSVVWGATAAILRKFGELLLRACAEGQAQRPERGANQ